MKCPYCGRENIPGSPFCADCGKRLSAPEARTAEATPVAETPATVEPVPAPEPAPVAEPALAEEAVPTPIISDGAIYLAPVTEIMAEEPAAEPVFEPVIATAAVAVAAPAPEPAPAPTPKPEPIPDPEPSAAFEGAFNNPPAPESQLVAEDVAVAEATEPAEQAEAAPEAETAEVAAVEVTEATEVTEAEPEPVEATEPEPAAPAAETDAVAATKPAPVTPVPPAPQPKQQPEQQPEPQPQFAPFASTPIVPPNPARAHTTYTQPGGETLYKKGCLAAAWDDIVQTKGWLGKVLLLGLIYCVPILNFFVLGYAMRWSRELFLGKVSPMPQRIFGNRMFVNGFFAFVLELVVGIVVGMVGFVLELIPFVGVIAYLALAFLVSAFQYLAILRIAVADRLGAGFDISQIWQTGKRNFGTLCCATIVPMLIIEAILFVVCFAVTLIMGMPLLGNLIDMANSSSYYYSDAQVLALVMEMLLLMLPLMLVLYVVACFLSAFMTVLIMRATGHYIARYAQDWKNEQAVMSTAYINGV